MDQGRRKVLRAGGSAGLAGLLMSIGFFKSDNALAADWDKAAFEAKTLPEAFQILGVVQKSDSNDIIMTAPDIAENGAVVPVSAKSTIPKTESISVLIEKNPNPLTAVFHFPDGTEPFISTRVKMGQTSNVILLVKADGKYYFTTKEIKVTLGGCGG